MLISKGNNSRLSKNNSIIGYFKSFLSLFHPSLAFANDEPGALWLPSDSTSMTVARKGGANVTDTDVVGIFRDSARNGGLTGANFDTAQTDLWIDVTPTVFDVGGSSGAYNDATNTFSNTSVGSNSGFPRFQFGDPLIIGTWYRVQMSFTGADTDSLVGIVVGTKAYPKASASEVNALFKAEATELRVYTNGTSTFSDLVLSSASIKAVPGFPLVAPSDTARPTWNENGGLSYLKFNGVDKELVANVSGFTSNMTVITAIETTDTKFVLHSGDTTSKHLLSVEQSSAITSITAGAGTPSLRVDGVDIGSTTRGSLYALLSDGNPHVITMSGADLTTWSEFGISNFAAGWFLNGKVFPTIAIDNPSTELRDQLEQYVASQSGATIL